MTFAEAPSPQRRQHDRVTRAEAQIADAAGLIGDPWKAETTLARLERLGDISPAHRLAGEQFQTLFRAACFDPLRAPTLDRPHTKRGHNAYLGAEPARRAIHSALDTLGGLGSPAADACWHVLGCEMSFRDYALRNPRLRREAAKGALLAALAILARHFGYERA